jgi:hypothetical protein
MTNDIKPEDITEWVEYSGNRYGVLPNGDQVEFLADGTPKVWKRGGPNHTGMLRQIPSCASEKKRRDR